MAFIILGIIKKNKKTTSVSSGLRDICGGGQKCCGSNVNLGMGQGGGRRGGRGNDDGNTSYIRYVYNIYIYIQLEEECMHGDVKMRLRK